MRTRVIVDTGPIVAFLNQRDHYHRWAVQELSNLQPPLLTCEAVLSEACFLMRRFGDGARSVMELVRRGLILTEFNLSDEVEPIDKLLAKYKDVPISLADACLVRMSEQISQSIVFTLDSDFRLYRKHGRQVIPTRMPKT
ncbi:MAG: PIN domain-containing protein [Deltaproteobacteria bacterium]|nr:PIN domain-containing protein [Deltaproteobacteria bacterium]